MSFKSVAAAVTTASLLIFAGSAQAAELINGTHYGSGNDYLPGNWTVASDGTLELGLRAAETGQAAPAPVGNVYTFALGQNVSFNFSFDPTISGTTLTPLRALITIYNVGTGGTASFNPLLIPDNHIQGSIQNSEQLAFGFLNGAISFNVGDIDYDKNVNSTYNITFTGGAGDTRQLVSNTIQVVQGSGAAVPEPATWALMILGFGSAGVMLRRRKSALA